VENKGSRWEEEFDIRFEEEEKKKPEEDGTGETGEIGTLSSRGYQTGPDN
jgi:hypothetical protein